jgi:hypothetical protein
MKFGTVLYNCRAIASFHENRLGDSRTGGLKWSFVHVLYIFFRPIRAKFRIGDVHKKHFGPLWVFLKIGAVKSCIPGRKWIFVCTFRIYGPMLVKFVTILRVTLLRHLWQLAHFSYGRERFERALGKVCALSRKAPLAFPSLLQMLYSRSRLLVDDRQVFSLCYHVSHWFACLFVPVFAMNMTVASLIIQNLTPAQHRIYFYSKPTRCASFSNSFILI